MCSQYSFQLVSMPLLWLLDLFGILFFVLHFFCIPTQTYVPLAPLKAPTIVRHFMTSPSPSSAFRPFCSIILCAAVAWASHPKLFSTPPFSELDACTRLGREFNLVVGSLVYGEPEKRYIVSSTCGILSKDSQYTFREGFAMMLVCHVGESGRKPF